MTSDIDDAIRKCLGHQKWILGPEVSELEDKLALYLKVKHCIGVSSGTDALVLALRAQAIKLKGEEYFDRNDRIITTSFTFTATGDAILRSGATPLFVDIDPATYNIDTARIESYLTSSLKAGNKIVGIIPVHLYGQSCDMDEITRIAEKYDLFVVEDVAQAFGGEWRGKKLGSIGDFGAFSFFPSKNLGGFGDGGLLATNDDVLAELAGMLRKHGGKDKYNVDHIGYNARLDTLQAAVLLAKMKHIEDFNRRRRNIAKVYNKGMGTVKDLILPESAPEADHVYHQYTIRVLKEKRDKLQEYLKENGIGTMVYYPVPLHKMKVFENRCEIAGELSLAERASKEVLSLPIEPLLTEEELNKVVGTIKDFFAKDKGITEEVSCGRLHQ
ncbi:MAG: DegT/DnrJ/EryC1/StrS family aminotransferase [Candidatus Omnitrophica bacterium]|nr:DegT/DnrJ/EryC1/StrS family aminotransferase [Candidatus Omnitrophota bacterium]